MNIELLKQLLAVPSPSRREELMVAFLTEHVRRRGTERCGEIVTDRFNNVCIRKGKPGVVPCLAAHLDTVHEPGTVRIVEHEGRLSGVDESGKPTGCGADDKAGVFVCLELLEQYDQIKVILFAGEEIGGRGAQHAPEEWFKDVGYLIEFDCPGRGLVSYTSGYERLFANDREFIQTAAPVMQAHGLTRWQHHPFSDVMILRHRFHFSCLNLSCGYYRWHQPDEFLVINEVEAAIKAGEALIRALGTKAYPFTAEDKAQPLFEVTSLQVSLPPEPNAKALDKAATEPLSTVPISPDEDDDTPLLEDYSFNNISFFKVSLLGKLMHQPYHKVTLEGPIKVRQLAEEHRAKTFRSETIIDRSGNLKISRLLLRFKDEAFGCLEENLFKIYAPTPESAQDIAKQFRCYIKPQGAGQPYFFIIGLTEHGPTTETVNIERTAPVDTRELALHYGDDFPAWETGWRERLRQNPSGLSILHGPTGCGKTSYLRALMARLVDKAVFYFVPVSAADMLFDPRYVAFWIGEASRNKKKQKIVLLEDAEDLLLPRDGRNRDKVSNLLNLADGFLGDHLKLHVIATTNALVRELDSAILRPGRLLGSREFRRLNRNEAQRLASAKGLTLPDMPDYSLAEIYNGGAVNTGFNGERRVGFAP